MKEVVEKINRMRSPRKLLVLSEEIKNRVKALIGHASSTESVGHYAEWLTVQFRIKQGFECMRTDLETQAGHDLEDSQLKRIQVKARVEREGHKEPKTYIRDVNIEKFDYLIYIVFKPDDYKVKRVFGMKTKVFCEVAKKVEHKNSVSKWSFHSKLDLFDVKGVENLTPLFRDAE